MNRTMSPRSELLVYQKVKARAKARSAAVTLAGQDIGGLPVRRAQGEPIDSAQGEPPIADRVRPGRAGRCRGHFHCGMTGVVPQNERTFSFVQQMTPVLLAPFTGLCPAPVGFRPGLSGLGGRSISDVQHALARFLEALA